MPFYAIQRRGRIRLTAPLNVNWERQARWVEDGRYFTSSGVSAGMDMSLGAISKMHGIERAEEVAKWCEYEWHRDANWDPFAKIHGLI